jgi:hypothetical protein
MTSQRLRDLDNKYCDDRGISGIWSNYKDAKTPYWDLDRQFHPLTWGFGVEVNRQVGDAHSPHMLIVSVTFGPWSWGARREWPADRDEYLAWAARRDELES